MTEDNLKCFCAKMCIKIIERKITYARSPYFIVSWTVQGTGSIPNVGNITNQSRTSRYYNDVVSLQQFMGYLFSSAEFPKLWFVVI